MAIGSVDVGSLEVINFPFVVPQLEGEATVDGLLRVPGQVLAIRQIVGMVKVGAILCCQLNCSSSGIVGQLNNGQREKNGNG